MSVDHAHPHNPTTGYLTSTLNYTTPAAVVQWIERAPPKSRNAFVGIGIISAASHQYPT